MSKPKQETELDSVWAEATASKDEALKARNHAAHAAAVVHVAQDALAAAHAKAAEAHLHAEAADKKAQADAAKARKALEDGLGLASEAASEDALKPSVKPLTAPVKPVTTS